MVHIARHSGEDGHVEEDSDEEEEYDENKNVKINLNCLDRRIRRTAQEDAGNANVGTGGANGAPSTPSSSYNAAGK
jgi:hypothetical protein